MLGFHRDTALAFDKALERSAGWRGWIQCVHCHRYFTTRTGEFYDSAWGAFGNSFPINPDRKALIFPDRTTRFAQNNPRLARRGREIKFYLASIENVHPMMLL